MTHENIQKVNEAVEKLMSNFEKAIEWGRVSYFDAQDVLKDYDESVREAALAHEDVQMLVDEVFSEIVD